MRQDSRRFNATRQGSSAFSTTRRSRALNGEPLSIRLLLGKQMPTGVSPQLRRNGYHTARDRHPGLTPMLIGASARTPRLGYPIARRSRDMSGGSRVVAADADQARKV